MKRVALFVALASVMWMGCGTSEEATEPQSPGMETEPQLASQVSALSVCGLQCPAGYHAANYKCDVFCGQCVNTCYNAADCVPNDSAFWTCGKCPTGYRASNGWCDPMCSQCGGSCFGLSNSYYCTKI